MSFNLNNPFSEKKILGPGETDPKADVELARTLLGDEAAEEYAEALAGSGTSETLNEGLTDEEKAAIAKHAEELAVFEEKQRQLESIPGERIELTIGGKTKEALLAEMETKGINVGDYVQGLTNKITFPETKEHLTLVKLTLEDLGFPKDATTEDIYAKAKELGLEVVPPETALYLRLEYSTQLKGVYLFMGMDPISDRHGRPYVFGLRHDDYGLWLGTHGTRPDYAWGPDSQFVFRFRK